MPTRIRQEIQFAKPPIMFAAWPGMGNVGLIAMDYLRRRLSAEIFAEIDMSAFFIPEAIAVKDGLAQAPELPSSIFSFIPDPAVIIFESNAQAGGRDGIALVKTLLDMAERHGVTRMYTAAAFAQSMSYKSPSQVLAASSNEAVLESLQPHGIAHMPDGVIAGLNGLALGAAQARGVEAACLLATIPSYAASLAYPKASLEIVKVLAALASVEIDVAGLEADVEEMDEQLSAIEERIRRFFPANTDLDEEAAGIEEEKVPHYIMEKIEELFKKASKDHSQAGALKEELDRWNLYELYENRFLDLFEDDDHKPKPDKQP